MEDIYCLDNFNPHVTNKLELRVTKERNLIIYQNDVLADVIGIDSDNKLKFNISKYINEEKYFYTLLKYDPDRQGTIWRIFIDNPHMTIDNCLTTRTLYSTETTCDLFILFSEYHDTCQQVYFNFYKSNLVVKNKTYFGYLEYRSTLNIHQPIYDGEQQIMMAVTNAYIKYMYIYSYDDNLTIDGEKINKNQKYISTKSFASSGCNVYFYLYKFNSNIIMYLHKIIIDDCILDGTSSNIMLFCKKNHNNEIIHNYTLYMDNLITLTRIYQQRSIGFDAPDYIYYKKFITLYTFSLWHYDA